jgi:hypothetical protein
VKSIVVNPGTILSGTQGVAIVSLNDTPASALTVGVTSSNPAYVANPGPLSFPANQSVESFVFNTQPILTTTAMNFTGSLNGTMQGSYTLNKWLGSATFSAGTWYGLGKTTLTITLAMPAPTGGYTVHLQNDFNCNCALAMSLSSGATTLNVPVTAIDVTTATLATIKLMPNTPGQTSAQNTIQPNTIATFKVSPSPVSEKSSTKITATATLQAPVTTATTIVLASSATSLVQTPTAITIPAGSATSSTTLTHNGRAGRDVIVTIKATRIGVTKTATVVISP